jgi:hypothetical protein
MRTLRYLLVSGSAAAAAGAMMLAGQAAVTTAAAPAHAVQLTAHQPSAKFIGQARAALVRYLRNSDPRISISPVGPKPGSADQKSSDQPITSSYNWSGYADSAVTPGTFTSVSGRWVTPRVTCTREDQISSAWVGLDGYSSSTVEQAGTVSWCYLGRPTYFTWYEMYPASTVQVGSSLRPGDRITASVTRTGSLYRLTLVDSTRPANSFSVTSSCSLSTCKATSAEWIVERPSFPIGIAPLADYSTLTFTNASQTAGGIPGTISGFTPNYKVGMIDATTTYGLSVPSALFAGGTSFTTRWLNSY